MTTARRGCLTGWGWGLLLWALPSGGLLAVEPPPLPFSDHLYQLEAGPALRAVGAIASTESVKAAVVRPATPPPLRVLWERELPDAPRGGVTAGDGLAYVALLDGTLRAFRLTDGQQQWKQDLGAIPQTGVAYAQGVVLVADSARRLHAYAAVTGAPLWEVTLSAQPTSDIGADHNVACIGTGDRSCVAFSLDEGRELWRLPTLGEVVSAPWVGKKVVVFGSTGHKLYAVAKLSGEVKQETILTGEVYGRASVEPGPAASALAVVGTHDGLLHAFSAAWAERWVHRCRGVVRAAPLVKPARVYAGTDQALVYAFERTSGEVVWRTGVGGKVVDRLVQLTDHLVVGAGGALKFLSPRTGEIQEVVNVNGQVRGVDEEEGTVVVVTTNRRLVAAGFRFLEHVDTPLPLALLASVVVNPVRINPRRGQRAMVTFSLRMPSPLVVDVADVRGRRVKLLMERERAWPDTYRVGWDGQDQDGQRVVPGVYRFRVMAGQEEVSVGLDVVGRR